jgi:hypothetical protein
MTFTCQRSHNSCCIRAEGRTDARRVTAVHHQIRAPWVISFDDGQVLRTPVPVGAAGWPTSQDN